jgi:hypothetical protein
MAFSFGGRGTGGRADFDPGLIAEVRAYWEALREGDMLPRRAQVDPRGIANALEHSFLIERVGEGIARFRIAGMVFNDLMGMDIRGMPVSALFLGSSRARLQTEMESVFAAPGIITFELSSERALGRGELGGRMAMMPMVGHDGLCTLAIGCIELLAEPGRPPRRFDITSSRFEAVGGRAVAPLRAPVAPAPEPVISGRAPGLAEPPAPAPRPPRALKGVPHLRLVKG